MVGVGGGTLVELLPPLFRAFRARYPAVRFDLYTGTADHIQDRMDRGLTDIGLPESMLELTCKLSPYVRNRLTFMRLLKMFEIDGLFD